MQTLRATRHNPNLSHARGAPPLSSGNSSAQRDENDHVNCANCTAIIIVFACPLIRVQKSLMSGRTYEFIQLDVFTQTPLAGIARNRGAVS
jgi:hypothetical protein